MDILEEVAQSLQRITSINRRSSDAHQFISKIEETAIERHYCEDSEWVQIIAASVLKAWKCSNIEAEVLAEYAVTQRIN